VEVPEPAQEDDEESSHSLLSAAPGSSSDSGFEEEGEVEQTELVEEAEDEGQADQEMAEPEE
jgi:hypothetical protein